MDEPDPDEPALTKGPWTAWILAATVLPAGLAVPIVLILFSGASWGGGSQNEGLVWVIMAFVVVVQVACSWRLAARMAEENGDETITRVFKTVGLALAAIAIGSLSFLAILFVAGRT
jgi:hypothetical protein